MSDDLVKVVASVPMARDSGQATVGPIEDAAPLARQAKAIAAQHGAQYDGGGTQGTIYDLNFYIAPGGVPAFAAALKAAGIDTYAPTLH